MKKISHLVLTLLVMSFTCISLGQHTVVTTTNQSLEQLETEKKVPAGRLWNLQDADILSVINEVSLETGKNFIVDPRVGGKISLISSKPLKPEQVYDVFLSVLGLLGFSAIPENGVIKIVPNVESGEMATPVATNKSPGKGEEIVVRVIPLENISSTQILPILRPMLPQWSNISAYSPGNILILMGHAANIKRILSVINNIDVAANNNMELVHLQHASAAQVATVLSNLQSATRANGDSSPISIAADERSNGIILSGNKSARLRMKVLISQLDGPAAGAQGNTDVIYLRYLEAKTLAPTLGKIAQNILKTGLTETTTNGGQSASSSVTGTNSVSPKNIENLTNIQAENNANAIIITAPPTLMKALKSIVAKLDIRPAQVLVQAVIVEIDQADLNNFGIQWGSKASSGGSSESASGASSAVSFPPLGDGTIGIIPGTQIKAVLSALENKVGVNILSTPSIVVLDNQAAVLKVGQDVPEQTGSYATTGTNNTVAPFNTIGRKQVVLELDVTPQINLGHAVRLKLNLKNETLQNPDDNTLNPLINISQIKNTVIVNSEDILVVGGLISNNISDNVDKIPILGDIPGIGLIFQHKKRSLSKKKLIAFIKPIILYNDTDAAMITNSKYNNIRQAQIDWPVDLTHEGEQKMQNILPPWKNNIELPPPFATAGS